MESFMETMGGLIIISIPVVLYLTWAVHAGNKVLTGHFEWLDRDATGSKICKFLLAFFIGSVIGGLYLMWACIKWAARD